VIEHLALVCVAGTPAETGEIRQGRAVGIPLLSRETISPDRDLRVLSGDLRLSLVQWFTGHASGLDELLALRFGDARVMALMAAITGFVHLITGFDDKTGAGSGDRT